jgi:hypothetical protein
MSPRGLNSLCHLCQATTDAGARRSDQAFGARRAAPSRALSAKTGLPVIHLDLHYWKPGWVRPLDDEWREKQRTLLAGEAWIADGNYHETLDLRLNALRPLRFWMAQRAVRNPSENTQSSRDTGHRGTACGRFKARCEGVPEL